MTDLYKRNILIIVCIIAGLFLVSIGGKFMSGLPQDKELPDGWGIIRPPHEVYTMIEDNDVIWAAGLDGVYKIDRRNGVLMEKLETSDEVTLVKALLIDEKGSLWIGHYNGIDIYNNGTFQKITASEGLPDNRVNFIYQDSLNNIFVGTWGGVAKYNGEKWEIISRQDGLMEDMVNVILEDSFGGLWFGHYIAPKGGVSYYYNGHWQYFSTDNGLPHNNVTSICEDSEKNILIGTGLFDRGGAVRLAFNNGKWTIIDSLSKEDGLAGEKVRYVYQSLNGGYWISSEYSGVAVIENGNTAVLDEESGLSGYEVKVMFEDVDGSMWLGTQNGITIIKQSALKEIFKLK